MKLNGKSDVGKVRSSNQDAFFVDALPDGSALAVVCDGMGGANAGNVASDKTVKSVTSFIMKSYQPSMKPENIATLLQSAVSRANIEVYDMSVKNPDLSGMGTTVVAAVVKDNNAVICHVGDSRAYLVNTDIEQITVDHSVVQSLLESGKLTPEQAKTHPKKNVITRAIGTEENITCDVNFVEMKNGDTLLLCTDGLTNFVETSDILKAVSDNKDGLTAELLVNKANLNGGGDNITVVTVTL